MPERIGDPPKTVPVVPGDPAAVAPVADGATNPSLSHLVVRGGAYLFGREAAGMVVRLVGVVITVREIGPADYGIYSAAAAFVVVLVTIAQMGSEVYLIRVKASPTPRRVNEVFTLLLCTSVLVAGLAIGLTYLCGSWLRPTGVLLPLRILLLSIPINVLWAPAQAHIERRFDYKKMGLLELGGDIALYGTAIPLALLKFGAWSLIAGYFAWQLWLLVGSLYLSKLRPRLAWSTETAREVTRHGATYSASSLLARLGGVVNPLVVGTFAGAVGVGYVSFALRLVDTIGFAQRAAYRLSLVTMSKVSTNGDQVRAGVDQGSLLLLLGLAIPFAAFGLVAHWVIPFVFGHQWTAAIPLYCLLTLAVVLNAGGVIQVSLLLAMGRNIRVAIAALIQTVVLAVFALLLVRWFGIVGFGVASLIALVDLVYLHRAVRDISVFRVRTLLPFVLGAAPPLFLPVLAPPLGLVLFLPALCLLLVPRVRRQSADLAHMVWRSLGKQQP